jgi:hypothetical protein
VIPILSFSLWLNVGIRRFTKIKIRIPKKIPTKISPLNLDEYAKTNLKRYFKDMISLGYRATLTTDITKKAAEITKVSLKTILSKPRLEKEADPPLQLLAKPVPLL